MHPKQREYRDAASTLVITVKTDQEFFEDDDQSIQTLEEDGSVNGTPTLSFTSYDELLQTITPQTLELIATVRREAPASINETARVVDRDVKNIHNELAQLAQLGVIYFEEEGRAKRPVVWFDELIVRIPVDSEDSDESVPASA